ncbi:MAG: glycosyltransferase, partial [Deltaproteobacteria bacterium]|nr:glycosyltransferase [Deltaproteobacteria bacterium]
EAFGNVVLEGLSCGLPVVVTRGVGAAEVLQGPLAQGVVNNPNDPAELVKKLTLQLGRSREPDFAQKARSFAEQYSWQNHFHKLESVLMEARAAKNSESVS